MKFIFLGDVHGDLGRCSAICTQNRDATVIQIGDLGVGFIPKKTILKHLEHNFRFFVGNHDCREISNTIPHCLGDFGEVRNHFFFVSGANSIDKDMRIEGVSWWKDEELSYQQAGECLSQWEKSNVDVLVAHDIPQSFAEGYKLIYDRCLTRDLLQKMIEVRKPKLFISGHHHNSRRMIVKGIAWIELDINESHVLEFL